VLEANSEVGLEVKTEKTMNMVMFRHKNAGHNLNLPAANECYENVAMFSIKE
jgi:hypothetical protein